jgi:cytochrome o ubiquinol oxidase subunit 2
MNRNSPYLSSGLPAVCLTVLLSGCSQMILLAPKGPVGHSERFVIITAFALMLIVVIPAIVMAFWFAWRYKASNTKAVYTPKWSYSGKIDLVVWLVPVAIVVGLGTLAWTTTHKLDPYRPIAPDTTPVSIEAVSLDWKWLFIYPDYHIATVNQIVFPVNKPLRFRITSDTVLASFFIPQLGSQLYAMPGREARLYLLADEPGTYEGHNQQFSGRGYAGMHFKAIAVPAEEFKDWVLKTKQSSERLDRARFEALARPSVDLPVQHFSRVESGLFDYILNGHRQYLENQAGVSEER